MVSLQIHRFDLPDNIAASMGSDIALDCEMLGLNLWRDRLCLVQIYDGKSDVAHAVHFPQANYAAPNLKALLADKTRHFLGHYIRADLTWIGHYLGIIPQKIYCTRTASRLMRTYGAPHDLETLCESLLGISMNKEQQRTYWGAEDLSEGQKHYALADVLYLHQLRTKLDAMLAHENRSALAQAVMDCIPTRAALDVAGWRDEDIFSYHLTKVD